MSLHMQDIEHVSELCLKQIFITLSCHECLLVCCRKSQPFDILHENLFMGKDCCPSKHHFARVVISVEGRPEKIT